MKKRKSAIMHRPISRVKPRSNSAYSLRKVTPVKSRRKKLALLLPGHNEELIIAATIRSAIRAGQNPRDIYVVDDCSTDATRSEALKLLDRRNVLTVGRSGKALAVYKAIKHFEIEENYKWVHVADADSIFGKDYFRIYRRNLHSRKYAVAVGFVQSLRGNWISTYRAMNYTYSQHIQRRVQSYLGMISVFPGPITCFRTDIISKLDFDTGSLTEDFDITLQVHRKKLDGIKYIPKAVNYTQDPETLKDFIKQTARWQRGFFQGVSKYGIGRQLQRIDVSLGFQMLQAILFLIQYFVFAPYVYFQTHNPLVYPVMIAADFIVVGVTTMFAAAAVKRWNVIGVLPYFYFLRWVELIVFFTAFFEVIVFKKFKNSPAGWSTEGRRYAVNAKALQDTAQ